MHDKNIFFCSLSGDVKLNPYEEKQKNKELCEPFNRSTNRHPDSVFVVRR